MSEKPLDAFERLRAALASAGPTGIGCHFWTHPTLGVHAEHLEALGLVTTIRTRIPLCHDHGCAILDTCAERITFAEARAGRARRKFKLTQPGIQVLSDGALLRDLIAEQPLASRIVEVLAEAGGSLGWLELYWRLLEPELAVLDETGTRPAPALTRSAVRFYLDLLVAAGIVQEDAQAGRVWLAPVPTPA